MDRELGVCALGDSFVVGAGDPEHLGWVGRVAARSHDHGLDPTVYNLGVRGETSRDVLARWQAECAPRLRDWPDARLVVAFGTNDTTVRDGAPRVPRSETVANLAEILRGAAASGWPVLVVGPPPLADDDHTAANAELDTVLSGECLSHGAAYVSVLPYLQLTGTWAAEARAGDGAHPGAAGYAELADVVWPHWWRWLTRPAA